MPADLHIPAGVPVLDFGGFRRRPVHDALGRVARLAWPPALARADFAESGLPLTLENVSLEYFVKAIAALRQAAGGQGRVVVLGISRGSETALLLGAAFPDLVSGVAAYVPSSVANPGLAEVARCSVDAGRTAGDEVVHER